MKCTVSVLQQWQQCIISGMMMIRQGYLCDDLHGGTCCGVFADTSKCILSLKVKTKLLSLLPWMGRDTPAMHVKRALTVLMCLGEKCALALQFPYRL